MKSQKTSDYMICRKHNKSERKSGMFCKNTYVCLNRYCPNAFELACLKCKNQFHKDHAIKFVTLENFKTMLSYFAEQELKKSSTDSYEVLRKLKLVKDFRRKIQFIEIELGNNVKQLITLTNQLEKEEVINNKVVVDYSANFDELLTNSFQEFLVQCKNVGKHLDYNTKKDLLELNSPKLKELEDKKRKLYELSRRQIQQIKEYSMKIIEVILHQNESDDEQDSIVVKKRVSIIKEQDFNTELQNKKLYKEGIMELMEEIESKSIELRKWIKQIQTIEPSSLIQFSNYEYVRLLSIKEQNEQLVKKNLDLQKELAQIKDELSDLRKKVARMGDKFNEMKKLEDERAKSNKPDLQASLVIEQLKKRNQQIGMLKQYYKRWVSPQELQSIIYQKALKERQNFKFQKQNVSKLETILRRNEQKLVFTEKQIDEIIKRTELNNEKYQETAKKKTQMILKLVQKLKNLKNGYKIQYKLGLQ